MKNRLVRLKSEFLEVASTPTPLGLAYSVSKVQNSESALDAYKETVNVSKWWIQTDAEILNYPTGDSNQSAMIVLILGFDGEKYIEYLDFLEIALDNS